MPFQSESKMILGGGGGGGGVGVGVGVHCMRTSGGIYGAGSGVGGVGVGKWDRRRPERRRPRRPAPADAALASVSAILTATSGQTYPKKKNISIPKKKGKIK